MRRIIGFFGLVLIFTNCVTLFHSARVLEPNQYELGMNLNSSAAAVKDYNDDDIKLISSIYSFGTYSIHPFSTPFLDFFFRQGWGKGFNTGFYIGFPYIDLFCIEEIIKEQVNFPSISVGLDIDALFAMYYGEAGIYASLNTYKSNIFNNSYVNLSTRIQFGKDTLYSVNVLEGKETRRSNYYFNLMLENEIKVFRNSYIMPYLGGGVCWKEIGKNPVFELNLGIAFFHRS